MAKFSVLDLTLDQIADIETATGIGFQHWDDRFAIRARVWAISKGLDPDEFMASQTARTFTDAVVEDAKAAKENPDPNPDGPGEP